MTSTRERVSAVLFAVMMVVSMVGGPAVIGGAAAANAPETTESDLNSEVTSTENSTDDENGTTETENGTNESTAGITATQSDQGDELILPRDEDEEIYVGETVAIGFLATHTGDTYEWEVVDEDGQVLNEHLLYNDTAEVESTTGDGPPHAARVNSFRPNETGEYEISVVVNGTDEYNKTITVTTDDSDLPGNFSSRHELAQEFSPVLNFHPDENFYPTRYEAYVQNSELLVPPGENIDASFVDIGANWAPGKSGGNMRTTTDENNRLLPRTSGNGQHADYQEEVVDELYPETVYTSIHEDVSYKGETYTAIGYWMVYVHDPKPSDAGTIPGLTKHTGDQEPVFVLLDDNGKPQWVGAQQHFGGEVRPWSQVNKTDGQPTFWIAEGAHSNYYGPYAGSSNVSLGSEDRPDQLRYRPQSQYMPDYLPNAGTEPTDPYPTAERFGYYDFTTTGRTLDQSNYELAVLENQPWGQYEGDVYRYSGGVTRGSISMQQSLKWNNTSKYFDKKLYEDHEQRNATIVDRDGKGDPALLPTPSFVNPEDEDPHIGVLLANADDGMKPDDYVINLTATPQDGGSAVTKEYPVFIGTTDGTSRQNYELALPEEIDSGEWNLDLTLSLYDSDTLENQEETLNSATLRNVDIDRDPTANVELVSEPSGVYLPGDGFEFEVDVENVGDDDRTFFVGYGLVGSNGVRTDIDPVGENVTLDSGESTTLSVNGTLADEMRAGTYNTFVSVGDDETRDDTFDDVLSNESVVVPPEPTVENVSVERATEDSVVVNATATNEGGTAEWQSLAVSLPGLNNTTGIQLVDSDFEGVDDTDDVLFAPNETVGSEYGQNETELEYPLIEASTTDWSSGEQRSLLLELPAEQQGEVAYAKSVASADGEQIWAFGPGVNETDRVDQQREFVYVFQLVEEEARGQDVNVSISDVVNGQAGGIESPEPVEIDVEIDANGEPYPADVSGQMFDIEVGGEPVETTVLVSRNGPPGEYTLRFLPPSEQDGVSDPGEYDLDIEFVDQRFSIELTDNDSRVDAISYSEGESTQVAASLQIDRSGSMRGIIGEAKTAGRAFVEQGGEDDYVSVVSYSSGARVDQELTRLSEENRSEVVDSINGISAFGGTDSSTAMSRGLTEIEDAPEGTKKAGIHLSDGQTSSQRTILNDIVPEYNENEVCLYTIGFTSGADEAFLKDVANASDCGTYEFAAESGQTDQAESTLQEVFQDIGTDVSGDSVLYEEAGTVIDTVEHRFRVDESVSQTSLNVQLDGVDLSGFESRQTRVFASGASSALAVNTASDVPDVTLYDPDGNEVDPTNDPDVERSVVGDTISFQIDDPDPGEWSYEIANPDDQSEIDYEAQVTGSTQTTMDISTAADTYYVGDETDLTATLIGPDGAVENATVEAAVVDPDGTDRTVEFTERSPGEYVASVPVDENGTYTADINATATDVSRQATLSWDVDEDASLSVNQTTTTDIVQGTTDSVSVELTRDAEGVDSARTVTVGLSELTRTDGNETLSSSDIDLDQQSLELDRSESADIDVAVSAPDDAPPGTYKGRLQAFTDDGGVISETVTITVIEDATFEVGLDGTPESVTAGEPISVNATIENTGDIADDRSIELLVAGSVVNTTTVGLNATETKQICLSYPTTETDVGDDVSVGMRSPDMETAETLEILEDANLRLDLVSADSPVAVGDRIEAEVTVENTGEVSTNETVELLVDNTAVNRSEVSLAGNEEHEVRLSYVATEDDIGETVPIELAVSDDTASGTIEVLEDANLRLDLLSGDSPVVVGERIETRVTVENTGEVSTNETVELHVDNTTVNRSEVTLAGNEDRELRLSYVATEDDIGETVPIEIDVSDDTASETISVNEAESSSQTGGDSSGGSSPSGGGGGGTAPSQPTDEISIEDEVPSDPGTTVSISEESVNEITFEESGITGTMEVDELDEAPSSVLTPDEDRPFLGGIAVEVPDDLTDTPATLELVVPGDELNRSDVDIDDLVVLHASSNAEQDHHETLNTSTFSEDGNLIVQAETPGFSMFLITTNETADPDTTGDVGTSEEREETSDDGSSAEEDSSGSPDREEPEGDETSGADETPDESSEEGTSEGGGNSDDDSTEEDGTSESPDPPVEEPSSGSVPGFGVDTALLALVFLLTAAALVRRLEE
ncbi:hypothetical protein DQW50_17200 [Halorubrum sp. 48-1-W]|uniref:VWA domain-containing protein n=1 Tax=Halorubrum sp. 48-1-W TaxID=2249761 RepID=UPI000DCD33B2|nr:VWA domain-containing protein [Halorubrum sp. 48-1-W]RAW43899.1 hypothetical protein DQW50_17200 [Halorubrum sp. 48-1-W]